jgi:hypothetical protein
MKIRGDYPTLLNGVSEQPPHAMIPGQHRDQVNMHSDPVYGLSRRWGTLRKAQGVPTADYSLNDTRVFEWRVGGKEYAVLYGARRYGSEVIALYDKTGGQLVPVNHYGVDTSYISALDYGVTSITAVGEYLIMASPGLTVSSQGTGAFAWSKTSPYGAVWIRGGAYNRQFTLKLKNAQGGVISVTYTTPKASYDKALDISHIPAWVEDSISGTESTRESVVGVYNGNYSPQLYHRLSKGNLRTSSMSLTVYDKTGAAVPNSYPVLPVGSQFYHGSNTEYLLVPPDMPTGWYVVYDHKKATPNPGYSTAVAAAQHAYNTQMNEYILASANAILSSSIATKLSSLVAAAPVPTGDLMAAVADGDYLQITGAVEVTVSDGGDNSLIEGVDNTVAAITDLTRKYWVGRVVQVRPAGADQVFYMRAVNANVGSGFTDVTWEECAADKQTLTGGLIYGRLEGGALKLGTDPGWLALLGVTGAPDWSPSLSGDADTNALPYFVGKPISYLDVFQDRLLICCNGVVSASAVGDYLRFSRATVLSVLADDPVEVTSQGSEGDVITGGAFFDRNLILFGNRQYMLDGGTPLSITSALMPVLSAHAGANEIQPVAAGTSIYYAKTSPDGTAVHQLKPGQYAETADSFPITPHLRTYLGTGPKDITVCHEPTTLVLRTNKENTLFIFRYLEAPDGGRQQASWSRWVYGPLCGRLIACSYYQGSLILFFFADFGPASGISVHEQPMSASRSSRPYMDDMQRYGDPGVFGAQQTHIAYDASGRQYVGGPKGDASILAGLYGATGLWYGHQFSSSVTPNRAFVYEQERASLSGDLTVAKVIPKFTESGGADASVTDVTDTPFTTVEDLSPALSAFTLVGEQPLTSEEHMVVVALGADDYSLTLTAKEWLPMSITGLRWEGQYFNRTPRS